MVTQALDKLTAAWTAAGRAGKPTTMALFYFALGPDAEQMAADSLGDYYAFLGDYARQVIASAATDEGTVRQYLAGFEAPGTGHVICSPPPPMSPKSTASPKPRCNRRCCPAPPASYATGAACAPRDEPQRGSGPVRLTRAAVTYSKIVLSGMTGHCLGKPGEYLCELSSSCRCGLCQPTSCRQRAPTRRYACLGLVSVGRSRPYRSG